MDKYVIIVAGGSGKRMQSNIPKQFLKLKDRPVLMHTIEAFYNYDKKIHIVLTLPETHFDYWKTLCSKHSFRINHDIVKGGKTRFHSVKNGLKSIKGKGLIAIQDAVRPLVSLKTIESCFKLAEIKGNAIPVFGITESIRQVKSKSNKSVKRNQFKIVQTPQVFQADLIQKAYKLNFKEHFTDDASLLDEIGEKLFLIEGNRENIKITTHADMIFAAAMMA